MFPWFDGLFWHHKPGKKFGISKRIKIKSHPQSKIIKINFEFAENDDKGI